MNNSPQKLKTPEAYASCAYNSPLGAITLAAGEDGLKGLWFDDGRYFGGTLDAPMEPGANPHLDAACAWLDDYFAGGNPDVSCLTLAPIGGAVGHNPISIIVPCHRVIGASGNLTGFGGGIRRKLALLELEGADCSGFYVPKHSTAP